MQESALKTRIYNPKTGGVKRMKPEELRETVVSKEKIFEGRILAHHAYIRRDQQAHEGHLAACLGATADVIRDGLVIHVFRNQVAGVVARGHNVGHHRYDGVDIVKTASVRSASEHSHYLPVDFPILKHSPYQISTVFG